jgi:hypothetical protein
LPTAASKNKDREEFSKIMLSRVSNDPINNWHMNFYMGLGRNLAIPKCEGAANSLPICNLEIRNTTNVKQAQFAFGAEWIPKTKYIMTNDIGECVGIIAYNPEYKVSFLAHADCRRCAIDAMNKAMWINPQTMMFYGGSAGCSYSLDTVAVIEGFLSKNNVNVLGKDLLRGWSEREKMHRLGKGLVIAIETQTGNVFIPKNPSYGDEDEYSFYLMPHTLNYDRTHRKIMDLFN